MQHEVWRIDIGKVRSRNVLPGTNISQLFTLRMDSQFLSQLKTNRLDQTSLDDRPCYCTNERTIKGNLYKMRLDKKIISVSTKSILSFKRIFSPPFLEEGRAVKQRAKIKQILKTFIFIVLLLIPADYHCPFFLSDVFS